MVGRYAYVAGEAKSTATGLVPPDRPCEFNRIDDPDAAAAGVAGRVRFLMPTAWGFSGGANGCRWTGFDGSANAYAAFGEGDPDAVHDLLNQRIGNQRTGRRGTGRDGEQGSGSTVGSSAETRNRNSPADGGTVGPDPRLGLPRYRLPWNEEAEPALTPRPPGDFRASGSPEFGGPPSSPARPHLVACDAFVCLPELAGAAGSAARLGRARIWRARRARLRRKPHTSWRWRWGGAGSSAPSRRPRRISPSPRPSHSPPPANHRNGWSGGGRRAGTLPGLIGGATPLRAADLCLGLLESRIEAWAAYVAIDECYAAATERGDNSEGSDGSEDSQGSAAAALQGNRRALDRSRRLTTRCSGPSPCWPPPPAPPAPACWRTGSRCSPPPPLPPKPALVARTSYPFVRHEVHRRRDQAGCGLIVPSHPLAEVSLAPNAANIARNTAKTGGLHQGDGFLRHLQPARRHPPRMAHLRTAMPRPAADQQVPGGIDGGGQFGRSRGAGPLVTLPWGSKADP